jgi:hypothetical protein
MLLHAGSAATAPIELSNCMKLRREPKGLAAAGQSQVAGRWVGLVQSWVVSIVMVLSPGWLFFIPA